eukprot:3336111-Alexandrium_andersonii.AAC.1
MDEISLTRQLEALRGAPSCYATASSPIARRPSGGGPKRGLNGLCGGVLALVWGLGRRQAPHVTINPDMLRHSRA